MSDLELDEKYADTDETYSALVSYCMEKMRDNTSFDRIIYKYLIMNDYISGNTLCLILFEQGVLDENEAQISALKNGTIDSCSFLKEKIKNLEITPAQLALDPCTGSCVIMDPNTGELLACVSYPGYDTNRLANNMDSSYYNSLLQDASLPLYNNATQQATAPGSTFKMVTATAGLSEGVIDVDSEIKDEGIFEELGYNLKCWIYPGNHGYENVVDAIKDSCNYFFCTVGYRLSMTGNSYSGVKGINVLTKYAEAFGLGDDTGLEIAEGSTQIATEYPVSAAIGQSNNKFTTVQLARYVSAIANEGTVYNLTLISKVTDSDGKIISSYEPDILNEITDVSSVTWQTVKEGMREVVVTHSQFNDLTVELAGKTGTAQENENRPNHSLFEGYASW